MFSFGPIDLAVVVALALRRFGIARCMQVGLLLLPAYLWTLPPVPCGCFPAFFRRCADGRSFYPTLKSDLKHLAALQEIYYSDEYSNGILASGDILEIAGQAGWNSDQVFVAHDFVGQMEQALLNIRDVLEAAGGGPENLTRLTWYVTDKREYMAKQKEVGIAYRRVLGNNFPAMTMVVVSALVEDEAIVEIEASAVLPAKTAGKESYHEN